MRSFDLSSNYREVERELDGFARKQLPFAMAKGLTTLAQRVAAGEAEALSETFDRPTPFTAKAFGVQPARKTAPVSRVFAKDIQAAYLEPYLGTGRQVLGGKRAMLLPAGVKLNAYGNLPRNKLASLKGKPDTFVGPVTFKASGQTISGVWQRPKRGERRGRSGSLKGGGYGMKGSNLIRSNINQGIAVRTGLKLLIRFDDPKPVKPRLPYGARAAAIVERHWRADLDAALTYAMATAK